jgi:hypothetical protein
LGKDTHKWAKKFKAILLGKGFLLWILKNWTTWHTMGGILRSIVQWTYVDKILFSLLVITKKKFKLFDKVSYSPQCTCAIYATCESHLLLLIMMIFTKPSTFVQQWVYKHSTPDNGNPSWLIKVSYVNFAKHFVVV